MTAAQLVHAKAGYRPRPGWRLVDGHLVDPQGRCHSCGHAHPQASA